MKSNQVDFHKNLEDLIATGNLAQASQILEVGMSESSSDEEKCQFAVRLTELYIRQSRYREAYRWAMTLKETRGISWQFPYFFLVLSAYILLICRRLGLEGLPEKLIRNFLVRLPKDVSWSELNAILWGIYWQNLPKALLFNVLTCVYSEENCQKIRSYGFLGYSLTLKGHHFIGLIGLRHAMYLVRNTNQRNLKRDLMVWLGVAYQWSSQHDKCAATQNQFEHEFPDADPFLKMICHASRLHSSFTARGPQETKVAVDAAFNMASTLKESRNHIQIFGAHAALLALEGRFSESQTYLKKAKKASDKNDNNLDRFIFHRMAVVSHFYTGDLSVAQNHLSKARYFLGEFGWPDCYKQETERLQAILNIAGDASLGKRWRNATYLIFKSLLYLNFKRVLRAFNFARHILFDQEVGYWSEQSVSTYLRNQYLDDRRLLTQTRLERLTLQLTDALTDKNLSYQNEIPTPEKLHLKVGKAFPGARVFLESSIDATMQKLRLCTEVIGVSIFNEIADSISASCANGQFFVAVTGGGSVVGKQLTIGILLDGIDTTSPGIVESGLRILLSDYLNACVLWEARADEIRNQKNEAVARMTQMLAHDVRRPFSLLKVGLNMLQSARDDLSLKVIASKLTPELDKAIRNVDGLINDVLQIGSSTENICKDTVQPEEVIKSALIDTLGNHRDKDFSISYDFAHKNMIFVDREKVERVFANIIENAIQAMNNRGHLWFKTSQNDHFIEFTIGNSGSTVPIENISRLFDAFFTSGKRGGTGLGLAIAHKVVTAHGGQIRCESFKTQEFSDGMTEFIFTLPASTQPRNSKETELPSHSAAIESVYLKEGFFDHQDWKHRDRIALELEFSREKSALNRSFRILVADDEETYRMGVFSYLDPSSQLGQNVQFIGVKNADDAIKSVAIHDFDLIILDVDLGPSSQDGFELTKQLRKRGIGALICIHTNRVIVKDHLDALEAGADAFLPKPIGRSQLIRMMLQAIRKDGLSRERSPTGKYLDEITSSTEPSCEILVLDDNEFMLDAWVESLSGQACVTCLSSFESLSHKISENDGFLSQFSYVVTDFHYDNSSYTGIDVGNLVKSCRTDLPVFVCTDGLPSDLSESECFDGLIPKNPDAFLQVIQKSSCGEIKKEMTLS
jgi:signal transduction histidine kinase/CheY-like chemotaxis protein